MTGQPFLAPPNDRSEPLDMRVQLEPRAICVSNADTSPFVQEPLVIVSPIASSSARTAALERSRGKIMALVGHPKYAGGADTSRGDADFAELKALVTMQQEVSGWLALKGLRPPWCVQLIS